MQVDFLGKEIENRPSFHTQIDILLKTVLKHLKKSGVDLVFTVNIVSENVETGRWIRIFTRKNK